MSPRFMLHGRLVPLEHALQAMPDVVPGRDRRTTGASIW